MPYLTLLIISYARLFADAGHKLPKAPEGSATTAIGKGAKGSDFGEWFTSRFETTIKPDTNPAEIDWIRYKDRGATKLTKVLELYEKETGDKLATKDARPILKRLGFEAKKVSNKAYNISCECVKARMMEEEEEEEGEGVGEGGAAGTV